MQSALGVRICVQSGRGTRTGTALVKDELRRATQPRLFDKGGMSERREMTVKGGMAGVIPPERGITPPHTHTLGESGDW